MDEIPDGKDAMKELIKETSQATVEAMGYGEAKTPLDIRPFTASIKEFNNLIAAPYLAEEGVGGEDVPGSIDNILKVYVTPAAQKTVFEPKWLDWFKGTLYIFPILAPLDGFIAGYKGGNYDGGYDLMWKDGKKKGFGIKLAHINMEEAAEKRKSAKEREKERAFEAIQREQYQLDMATKRANIEYLRAQAANLADGGMNEELKDYFEKSFGELLAEVDRKYDALNSLFDAGALKASEQEPEQHEDTEDEDEEDRSGSPHLMESVNNMVRAVRDYQRAHNYGGN